MATKTAEKVSHTPQPEVVVKSPARILAVTSGELEAKQTYGPKAEVSEELMDATLDWMDEYKHYLSERAELYMKRQTRSRAMQPQGVSPEVGQPTVNNYVAWDILTLSPIELSALPYQQPSKIIRSGALCMILAIMWTNPVSSIPDGFAVPATIQLGGRDARISFDRLNLTTGAAGPSMVFNLTLPPAVPPLVLIPAFFTAPAVTTPELLEFNVTADVTNPAQPYAAFASWHFDIDADPSWFTTFPTPIPAQLQHEIPNRCMVYPE